MCAVPTAPEEGERPSTRVIPSSPGPPAGAAACATPHPVYAGYALAHEADLKVPGILDRWQSVRKRPRRRSIERRGRPIAQRFVRALFVVERAEAIEHELLPAPAVPDGARGLALGRTVHPFMGAILMGASLDFHGPRWD